jgi:hypothetical protein
MSHKLCYVHDATPSAWHRYVFAPKVTVPTVNFPHGCVCQNNLLQAGPEGVVQLWQQKHSRALLAVEVIPYAKSLLNEIIIFYALPEHGNIIKCLGYPES